MYAIGYLCVKREGKPLLADPEDRAIFRALIKAVSGRGRPPEHLGDTLTAVGLYLLGTPYASHTLERSGEEQLVINLRRMDCFTFVENALALARLIRQGAISWRSFAADLQTYRYRRGRRDGYASRLHYFSDWIADNHDKGVIEDITYALGGQRLIKPFSFMTTHRELYPALASNRQFRRMERVERTCSDRALYHLPAALLPSRTGTIRNGDIIAITTDLEGLDISHAGLAIHHKRSLHLLHASRAAGRVLISPETLYRYLRKRASRLGIMVARVR
jgi:hypothetical protein